MGDIFEMELDPSCNGFSLSLYGNDQGGINMLIHKYLLKHLINEYDSFVFRVEKKDYKQLLTSMKINGYIWNYDDIIYPEKDEYYKFIEVNNDLTISRFSCYAAMYRKIRNDYLFSEFLQGNLARYTKEFMSCELSDQMYTEQEQLREEIKIKNRETSLNQVKDEGLSI